MSERQGYSREIDARVTDAVSFGKRSCGSIEAHVARGMGYGMSPPKFWRVIDRSLQRLRKRGVIKYAGRSGGWQLCEADSPADAAGGE